MPPKLTPREARLEARGKTDLLDTPATFLGNVVTNLPPDLSTKDATIIYDLISGLSVQEISALRPPTTQAQVQNLLQAHRQLITHAATYKPLLWENEWASSLTLTLRHLRTKIARMKTTEDRTEATGMLNLAKGLLDLKDRLQPMAGQGDQGNQVAQVGQADRLPPPLAPAPPPPSKSQQLSDALDDLNSPIQAGIPKD